MRKSGEEEENKIPNLATEKPRKADGVKAIRRKKRKREPVISKVGGVYYVEEISENVRIPFFYRDSKKYAEKLMVEKTLIAKYYPLFGDDVFDCIKPKAVKVRPSEINLLNEINIVQGKCEYLNRPYTMNEVLIDINEVKQMAKFLDVCYNMLVIMRDDIEECGYLRIDNSETLIPFVNVNNQKLIPLFYFEGSHLNLGHSIINLNALWPLAYLKILCKMQNVKKDLYNYRTSLEVITYQNLLKMIKDGSNVEACWPDSFECNLLRKIPSQKLTSVKLHKEFKLQVNLLDEENEEDNSNAIQSSGTQMISVEETDSEEDEDVPIKVTICGDKPTIVKSSS